VRHLNADEDGLLSDVGIVERPPVSTPLVSVILTTYNRSNLLPRAIESVLTGTYANIELIIVDDASPDRTPEVVSRFKDPRLQYVRMPENGGVLRARNRGFDRASGDYVTILDDDDELLPDALGVVAAEFEKTEREGIDILWFDCQEAESGQRSGSMLIADGNIDFEDYVCGRIQGDFWIAFRKAAIEGNRFNENLKAHESLLWLRIHRTYKARHVPRIVCKKYREHGSPRLCDLSVRLGQLKQTTLALSLFLEEFGDVLTRTCPSVYGRRLAYLGLHQMAVDDFVSGRASILRSLTYRFSVKYMFLYVSSFFLNATHVIAIIARMES
jgi:glycosyltransferase involved in cell wall biosynthesis